MAATCSPGLGIEGPLKPLSPRTDNVHQIWRQVGEIPGPGVASEFSSMAPSAAPRAMPCRLPGWRFSSSGAKESSNCILSRFETEIRDRFGWKAVKHGAKHVLPTFASPGGKP